MSAGLDDRLDAQVQALTTHGGADVDRAGEPLGSYLRVAGEVQRVLAAESPHLSARTQAQHLNMLRSYARQAPRRRFTFSFPVQVPRWAQVALAVLVIFIVASGASTASANSLPGSPLYPVKRLVEQGQLVLAPDAAARARVWFDLAQRRLDEAQTLAAAQGQVNAASLDAIEASLEQALREIEAADATAKPALQQEARQVIRHQTTVLELLAANATPDERSRVQQTLNTLATFARTAGEPEPSPSPAPTWTAIPETTPTPVVIGTPTPRPSPTLAPPTAQPTRTTAPPTAVPTVPVSPTPEPSLPPPEPTGQFQAGAPEPDKNEPPEPADTGSGSDDNKGPGGDDDDDSDNKGSGGDDQDSDNKGNDEDKGGNDDKGSDEDKGNDDEDKGGNDDKGSDDEDKGGNDGKGGGDDRGKK